MKLKQNYEKQITWYTAVFDHINIHVYKEDNGWHWKVYPFNIHSDGYANVTHIAAYMSAIVNVRAIVYSISNDCEKEVKQIMKGATACTN